MDNVRYEWYHERVGRGYMVQVWDARNPKVGFKEQFDVVLTYGGREVMTMHSGSISQESAYYWYRNEIEFMKRLMILMDRRELVAHDLYMYSVDGNLQEPVAGCEEKWKKANEEDEMLRKWIVEMIENRFTKDDERIEILMEEFFMYTLV